MLLGNDITPVDADSLKLFESLETARTAAKNLRTAKKNVPNYTGQYAAALANVGVSEADYVSEEQNEFNIAVNAFGESLRDFIWKTSPNSR